MKAHIVPRFHLGRFATPPNRDGFIYLIEKNGRNRRVSVKQAATAEDFYVVEGNDGNPTGALEDMLQKIESYCARRIARLVETGQKPSDNDRLTLAYYIVLTHMRTPRMRQHLRWLSDTGSLAQFRSTLEADPPWQRMRAAVFAEMSDEEAEEFRLRTIDEIDKGNLRARFPDRYYVISTMEFLTEHAYTAADMSWTVMRAPNAREFVIGDHAVSMYDPSIGASLQPRGNALRSSLLAETVLPLDPKVAIKLSLSDEPWTDARVAPAIVDEINIRTYAWAETEVYGSSQALVVAVREDARRSPHLIAQFKPHLGALLMENDYPLVGGGHRREVVTRTPPARVST